MFIPEIETKPLSEIKEYQEARLRSTLEYLHNCSPYYQKVFRENNIDYSKIRTIEDLQNIPVTTKDDLQKYNREFFCVDSSRIVEYFTTSGTLGDPVIVPATAKDLDRLAYNEYISFLCSETTTDDIFQLIVTLDRRFMAGLAYYEGLKQIGAGIVRVGPGNPGLQFDTIERIKPTAFVTVPSFLIKLIDYAEANGIDYKATSLKKAVCIGENLHNADMSASVLAQKIVDKWGIKLYSTYASTEMGTSFAECGEGNGGHHHPELIIVEFLDENNRPVKDDEPGEVVITTLGAEAMPLLRFKTGDICYHYTEPCKCGRTTMRLGPIIGRSKQMIKYKGTTLYPPALYDVLNDVEGVKNYIVEVSTNQIGTDDILIKVGSTLNDENFIKKIKDHFRTKLRVAPSLEILDPNEIAKMQFPEMSRKAITFIDKRK